jgi:hypothetical protein
VIDYTALLYQWRADNIPNADRILVDEYYSDVIGKDTLVITAGDSWTYGESLGETRLSDVYGRKVSQALNADWINIGLPGRSNSYIIKNLSWLVEQFKNNNYKQIVAIATLTENGRELSAGFTSSIDFAEIGKKYNGTKHLYDELLNAIELEWIDNLNQLIVPSNCQLIVGQNFVWHEKLVANLSPSIKLLEFNWIEKLAEHQQKSLPPRAQLVTGWIFDSIHAVHNMIPELDPLVFKSWTLPYIDKAMSVNNWLATNDLNNKGASRHPVSQGHTVWANYLLSHINVD